MRLQPFGGWRPLAARPQLFGGFFWVGVLLSVSWAQLAAQTPAAEFTYDKTRVHAQQGPVRTVNLEAMDEPDWFVSLERIAPAPGVREEEAGEIAERKRALLRQQAQRADRPAPARKRSGVPPTIDRDFQGNFFTGSLPNDNHVAIANDGSIVSVVNTTIFMYNPQGNQLQARSLSGLAGGQFPQAFDPRVVFDPSAERFIVTYLDGNTDTTSTIVLAFSQTSDPTGDWNIYSLDGNPLDNDTWSDFPYLAVSKQDLYLTFNTFLNGSEDNSGYVESTIWQIRKEEGYAGDSALVTNYYHDIAYQGDSLFNTTAIKGGTGPYGPGMYFLSNEPFADSSHTIYLLAITDSVGSGNAQLTFQPIQMDNAYGMPPPAQQPDDAKLLDTNDGRIQGGFLHDSVLQFVANSVVHSTKRAGFYYGRISNPGSSTSGSGRVYTSPDKDLGYPNIAYAGDGSPDDHRAAIGVLRASDSLYPGFGTISVDNNFQLSSLKDIKQGEGLMDLMADTTERWGDYTGAARRFNGEGEVWLSGSYGNSADQNASWVAKVTLPQSTDRAPASTEAEAQQAKVFPNPMEARFKVDFRVKQQSYWRFDILATDGRVVKDLGARYLEPGQHRLGFSTRPLKAGTYLMRGRQANQDGEGTGRRISRRIVVE